MGSSSNNQVTSAEDPVISRQSATQRRMAKTSAAAQDNQVQLKRDAAERRAERVRAAGADPAVPIVNPGPVS